MSLMIPPRPSQAGDTIKWTTIFVEDDTQAGLQTKIDALSDDGVHINNSNPQGWAWLADIQYQTSQKANNIVNYSVMIVIGEWNPTP